MTVKLAKFFSNSPGGVIAPQPPLSSPANLASAHSYYHATNHLQQQQQQQQQQPQPSHHYNPYVQDDDDNMSLYSTTASIMTTRDHPFNNSQRPLLAERKPQLLNKKKMPHAYAAINQKQPQLQQQQQQLQHQHQQQQHKSCISPYVQQQKRDSAKGVHGFNDFDILSQQYNQHLQSPHIGYPYGSPPSPTANSNDFAFEALAPPMQNAATNTFAAATSKPHYGGGMTNYATAVAPTQCNDINEADYYGNLHAEGLHCHNSKPPTPSRFEDDFCCRRNVEFSKDHHNGVIMGSSNGNGSGICSGMGTGGPFIFGVPHEQQSDLGRMPVAVAQSSSDTVINALLGDDDEKRKYCTDMEGQATMQSTSDTSSSSRDSGGTKGAKFLLRKHKSKKNSKDKQSKTETPTTTPQLQPSLKCVVVGDGAVGKTNLILSYLENRFNTEHVPTASDIYNADVMVNDSPVHLTLCDTAGQDTLDPLRELCYPDSNVFLLCFSVTKPETFHAIKTKWAPKFTKTKAALILVGTQADLRTNSNVLNKLQTNGEKPISYADAWDLARTIGAKYIETSSVTQDKVKEVFDTAIWEGLIPSTLPATPPLWKKLFCLV